MSKKIKDVIDSVSHKVLITQLQVLGKSFIELKQGEMQLRREIDAIIEKQVRIDAQLALIRSILPVDVFNRVVEEINAQIQPEAPLSGNQEA